MRFPIGLAVLLTLGCGQALAHSGNIPPSLREIKVPVIPGLLDGAKPIVVNKEKAIVLGKALFWDMNVGSDGMACGSCHFHAGADSRSKNQLSPGKSHLPAQPTDANKYDPNDPRGPNLANYPLTKRDFPLNADPLTGAFSRDRYTYNAVASAGTFSGRFVAVSPSGPGADVCTPFTDSQLDQTFRVGNVHTRRVEPRNAPTIINAVLFDRNFWDGRANNVYNGVSIWGPRDPNAYVWVADKGAVWKTRIALPNASLASQALGPALNEFEMSCKGRSWPDIGRKLLKRRALENQAVHPQDSALGSYANTAGKGLTVTYESLVKEAFPPRYWSAAPIAAFGKPSYSPDRYSQAEANFAFFFGIAIQLYGSTLISDDTPFDRANITNGGNGFVDQTGILTQQQLHGFKLFNEAHCIFCHQGPLFSTATNRETYYEDGKLSVRTMVNRDVTVDQRTRTTDAGFLNNGAAPGNADPGLDNVDDFGHPLGFTPQYLASLAGRPKAVIEPLPRIKACEIGFNVNNVNDLFTVSQFGAGNLISDPAGAAGCPAGREAFAVVPRPGIVAAALDAPASHPNLAPSGSMFKVPQLYNVELTGPYMHNGGMSSLAQVLNHYLSGGAFRADNPTLVNGEMDEEFIFAFFASESDRLDMIAFLNALTDERVRYERAPFDHPQIRVPNGHPGNETLTQGSTANPRIATDDILDVPAVGRNGRNTPLGRYEDLLPD